MPTSLLSRATASAQLAAEYLFASIRRDKRGTCFGIITVALVVCFSTILQAAIESSPVIFLRLAEGQASEADAYLLPEVSADAQMPLINHTAYCRALASNPAVAGCAPRWTVLGDIASTSQPARRTSAFVLALDSRAEAAAGLGRAWGRRPLGAAEAYVSQTALDELGVSAGVGERVTVQLNVPKVLGSITAAASTSGTSAAATYGEGAAANATGSGGGSLAPPPQTNAQFIEALLAAAGVSLGDVWVTVDALAALRGALAAAGLADAVNTSATGGSGGGLVRVNLGPLLRAAVVQARRARRGGMGGRAGA